MPFYGIFTCFTCFQELNFNSSYLNKFYNIVCDLFGYVVISQRLTEICVNNDEERWRSDAPEIQIVSVQSR